MKRKTLVLSLFVVLVCANLFPQQCRMLPCRLHQVCRTNHGLYGQGVCDIQPQAFLDATDYRAALIQAGQNRRVIESVLQNYLPAPMDRGLAWVPPATVGVALGVAVARHGIARIGPWLVAGGALGYFVTRLVA